MDCFVPVGFDRDTSEYVDNETYDTKERREDHETMYSHAEVDAE